MCGLTPAPSMRPVTLWFCFVVCPPHGALRTQLLLCSVCNHSHILFEARVIWCAVCVICSCATVQAERRRASLTAIEVVEAFWTRRECIGHVLGDGEADAPVWDHAPCCRNRRQVNPSQPKSVKVSLSQSEKAQVIERSARFVKRFSCAASAR